MLIMTDIKIDMRTVSTSANLPRVPARSVAIKVPVIPCFGIIKIDTGTFVQAMAGTGKAFIPAIRMFEVLLYRSQISSLISAGKISGCACFEEVIGSHGFHPSNMFFIVFFDKRLESKE